MYKLVVVKLAVWCVAALSLSGCFAPATVPPRDAPTSAGGGGSSPLITQAAKSSEFLTANSVVVMPIEIGRSVRDVVGREAMFLDLLRSAINQESGLQLKGDTAADTLVQSKDYGAPSLAESLKIAGRAGADTVLRTTLNRFEERVGSRIGASSPASVYFTMSLVRASGGEPLWSGSFHFDDRPLSDNLFGGGRGVTGQAGWQDALTVLREAFILAAKDIGERRRGAFVR